MTPPSEVEVVGIIALILLALAVLVGTGIFISSTLQRLKDLEEDAVQLFEGTGFERVLLIPPPRRVMWRKVRRGKRAKS